jgi:hypothetical protein
MDQRVKFLLSTYQIPFYFSFFSLKLHDFFLQFFKKILMAFFILVKKGTSLFWLSQKKLFENSLLQNNKFSSSS